MPHKRQLTVTALTLLLFCGCGEAKWKSYAEVVCTKQEELLPILRNIRNREDVVAYVDDVEAWREEYSSAMWGFSEFASKNKIVPVHLQSYEDRFAQTFLELRDEAMRIVAIGEHFDADKEFQKARGYIVTRATTFGNPFTSSNMSAAARLMKKYPDKYPPAK